jgi:hypothetical protein
MTIPQLHALFREPERTDEVQRIFDFSVNAIAEMMIAHDIRQREAAEKAALAQTSVPTEPQATSPKEPVGSL